MKVSETQQKVLETLSQPYKNGKHHPKDAFQERSIYALEKKGLVEIYHHSSFLHGAVRLTEEGKKLI
jgi:hypothetical protein